MTHAAPYCMYIQPDDLLHIIADKQKVDEQQQTQNLDCQKEVHFNLLSKASLFFRRLSFGFVLFGCGFLSHGRPTSVCVEESIHSLHKVDPFNSKVKGTKAVYKALLNNE